MPNWCDNKLTIGHSDSSIVARARNAFMNRQLLNEFIPIPHELKIVSGRIGTENDPKQVLLVAQYAINKAKYGYKDWYDFSIGEWGTKWDVGYDKNLNNAPFYENQNEFTVTFESAWSPPINAYDKLFLAGFEIEAYYFEGSMGFCGEFKNGKDTEYKIRDAPSKFYGMFGIELDGEE